MEMTVNDVNGSHLKVSLDGRLDTAAVDRIETALVARVVPRGLNAIVDLSKVDFIGSMGVRMLISTARALSRKNARLVLLAPQEGVREVFDSVSLGDIIKICAEEAEAVAAFQA